MRSVTSPQRTQYIGYAFYIAVMAAGYYYNLTFVQLGLIDLGTRRVGLSSGRVSAVMAGLALGALIVAVVTGRLMDLRGWSTRLKVKLKILSLVLVAQTTLTAVAPFVLTLAGFVAWVAVCSVTIGVGIPVTFSFMIDFVPVRLRGRIAATVAGLAFFAAALYPLEWRIEAFAPIVLGPMAAASVVLVVVSFRRFSIVEDLGRQHERFGVGRYCRPTPIATASSAFWIPVGLMFSVFFIDSLGFLRIIDTPALISTSWQSTEIRTRLFIAVAHLIGAAMAGVIYTAMGRRWVFASAIGLFAFTHLLYTFQIRTGLAEMEPPLALPLFYVLAVSFYTTLNFALWPDLSTPRTIGTNTAIGVGVAGWLASFLSTSLALWSSSANVSVLDHLLYVNAIALVALVTYPVALYLRRVRLLIVASSPTEKEPT